MLLQEPLLVVAGFYLLFVLVIIYVRMDFAISKVLYVTSINHRTVHSFPACTTWVVS